jgi:hypothetical protein
MARRPAQRRAEALLRGAPSVRGAVRLADRSRLGEQPRRSARARRAAAYHAKGARRTHARDRGQRLHPRGHAAGGVPQQPLHVGVPACAAHGSRRFRRDRRACRATALGRFYARAQLRNRCRRSRESRSPAAVECDSGSHRAATAAKDLAVPRPPCAFYAARLTFRSGRCAKRQSFCTATTATVAHTAVAKAKE